MKKGKDGFYCRYIKRILDILCALAAMIVFCWLYALIAILVRVKLGSPVIFKQERPGKIDPKTGKEKVFCLLKYRTMSDRRDSTGNLLPDEERLTKFGSTLRKFSGDELLEAWNILKGDMSVVGPRPLLVEYLPYYTEREHHRHDVRPGLTGWAQVNGRNYVGWEKRFTLDLEYVESVSFAFDIKVIFLTLVKLVKHSDISVDTQQTEGNFAEIRSKELGKAR